MEERLSDIQSQGLVWIIGGPIIFIFVSHVSDRVIETFCEWYVGIFVTALLPIIFSYIDDRLLKGKSIWKKMLLIVAIILSIVGFIIAKDIIKLADIRLIVSILMSVFFLMFLSVLINVRKEKAEYYSKKLSKKGIRRDLYNRTSRLDVNIKKTELVRCCEKYFDCYIRSLKKIKGLRTIEYVTLGMQGKKIWYTKVTNYMEIALVGSIYYIIVNMELGITCEHIQAIVYIVVFIILQKVLKCMNYDFLQVIVIRYFYDEWGYYLTDGEKDKFVGTVQLIETSKYHRYVHSFLDITALCRAIVADDKLNKENKICIVSNNLSDLFLNYSDFEEEKNWIMVLPLWIAALFEFSVTGKIDGSVKKILLESVNENVKADINIFLQSFWVDMERKELDEEISKYIYLFEMELYAECV